MVETASQTQIILTGIVASLLAGCATGLGALPVFFTRNVSERINDGMLGFAAGVMLAATSFSLIVPALEYGGGGVRGAAIAAFGILLGGLFLDMVDRYAPHRHFLPGLDGGGEGSALAKIWLFVIAIAIHNFPEGLAVGVATGSGDLSNGITLALGIGLQNLPEGLAVAVALVGQGYSPLKSFGIALATGLVEPVGGLIGVAGVVLARPIIPYALAFAAGAMLFVISDEIIPETHKRGNERIASLMVLTGFVIMMFLDTALQ